MTEPLGSVRMMAEADYVARYCVRRWTAFEWSPPEGAEFRVWRKEKEDHLARAAGMISRKLREMCPDSASRASVVRVARHPELVFEMQVTATSEDDAQRRAMYRFDRALQAKIPDGFQAGKRRTVRLNPPWGKVEVDLMVVVKSREAA